MHDSGNFFTSRIFRHFPVHNEIKDKIIPISYLQLLGKIKPYNKIVKNELLAVKDIPNRDDGKIRYDDMRVKAHNETREHGDINGVTPSEVFLQSNYMYSMDYNKQQSVAHIGNRRCSLSV